MAQLNCVQFNCCKIMWKLF